MQIKKENFSSQMVSKFLSFLKIFIIKHYLSTTLEQYCIYTQNKKKIVFGMNKIELYDL